MSDPAALRPWLILRAVRGLSEATFCHLVQAFGSAQAVLAASPAALVHQGDVRPFLARAIQAGVDGQTARRIDQELARLDRLRLRVLCYGEAEYPARLQTIPDPPPMLYLSGALAAEDQYAVAVVGARRATPTGRLVTEELSRQLAEAGFTVISGLARGVDGAAHRGALSVGGRTLAVLGCGIDRTYPPEHEALRRDIETRGAVLSEFPLGAPPHGYHFPRRNRIISGLALGVVITEATLESGSLITARLAADQGREVFAVPGSVRSEASRGPHSLIKQGAKLVESVEDILEELLPQLDQAFRSRLAARAAGPSPAKAQLTPTELQVYALLGEGPMHIDEVIGETHLPAPQVSSLLLALEIKGLVRQFPGPSYVRL